MKANYEVQSCATMKQMNNHTRTRYQEDDWWCRPKGPPNEPLEFAIKPTLIFVLYLEDHLQAQELSTDLPGSYKMEEIFCSRSASHLKIRVEGGVKRCGLDD